MPVTEVVLATAVTVLSVVDSVLAGMIAAGLCTEAIALYLDSAEADLFDRAALLGLPQPNSRPMRRAGGKRAWSAEDVRLMIALWTGSVHTRSIADSLGRSRGSIYSKRRRLGLPLRPRKGLEFRSIDECRAQPTLRLFRDGSLTQSPSPAQSAVPDISDGRRPAAGQSGSLVLRTLRPTPPPAETGSPIDLFSFRPVNAAAPITPAPVPAAAATKKIVRLAKAPLTQSEKLEIERRGLAGQKSHAIARDLGKTICQITSWFYRSHVSRVRQRFNVVLTETYDPAIAERNIAKWRLTRKEYKMDGRINPFWTSPGSGEYFPCFLKFNRIRKNAYAAA